MINWNQAPLVRLLIPFITGILTAILEPFPFLSSVYLVYLLPLIISIFVFVPQLNISYKRSWWFGLIVNVCLFLFGYQLTELKTEKFAPDHFSKYTDSSTVIYVRLTEPYLEKPNSLKVIGEVLAVTQQGKWKNSSGKLLVYLQKGEKSASLKYGDELFLKTNLREITPPKNPGEFDYKRFLSFHNVYHQAYIKDVEWFYSGFNSANGIKQTAIELRNKLLNIFKENNIKGNEFAVGSALLLGYEDKLDAEILSAYASTGVLHILSVSGLHVAIVYLIFNWLLFFLDKIKYGNVLKAFLLLFMLWSYALITGFSPSVLRAATMFSIIVIAKAYNRHTNIYNTLAASAFLLLIVDPFYIMDVGFQLSYIAVIGIVFIQPKIQQFWEPENWIMNQIWIIVSVSIAAQIATFPLSIYYFHQFPNYFLLSNLIAIPVSTAVIYLGILIFAFAKFSFVSTYLAMGFNYCVWFLNQTVLEIEKWPFALLSGISITAIETIILYGLIIFILAYFLKPKFYFLMISLSLLIVFAFLQISEQIAQNGQKRLIVYTVNKSSVIDFIDSRSNVLLVDSTFNNKRMMYSIKNNWINSGINKTEIISGDIKNENLLIYNSNIQFYNKRIKIVNEEEHSIRSNVVLIKPLKVDYVIISKNNKISMEVIKRIYEPETIVFDASNTRFSISKWKKECVKLDQHCYSVLDSGAFVVDL